MDTLSSCYFCGIALDEPLETYPISGTGQPGDETGVTLCSTCHQKLETVLDVAGAGSVGESSESVSPTATAPGSGEAVGSTSADDVLVEPVEESLEMDDELEIDSGEETADSGGGGSEGTTDTAEKTEAEGDVDEQLQSMMDPDVPEEFGSVSTPLEADEEKTVTTDETATNENSKPEVTESGDTATEEGKRVEADETDGDEDTRARSTVSALEYNKVMRLLQNRKFPVDRDEIETIAVNAYDLSECECAEVIDLAVDRGLLKEEDGALHRPE